MTAAQCWMISSPAGKVQKASAPPPSSPACNRKIPLSASAVLSHPWKSVSVAEAGLPCWNCNTSSATPNLFLHTNPPLFCTSLSANSSPEVALPEPESSTGAVHAATILLRAAACCSHLEAAVRYAVLTNELHPSSPWTGVVVAVVVCVVVLVVLVVAEVVGVVEVVGKVWWRWLWWPGWSRWLRMWSANL